MAAQIADLRDLSANQPWREVPRPFENGTNATNFPAVFGENAPALLTLAIAETRVWKSDAFTAQTILNCLACVGVCLCPCSFHDRSSTIEPRIKFYYATLSTQNTENIISTGYLRIFLSNAKNFKCLRLHLLAFLISRTNRLTSR